MDQGSEAGAWRTAGAAAGVSGRAWRAADHASEIADTVAIARRSGALGVRLPNNITIILVQPAQQPPRSAAADNWRRAESAPPQSREQAPRRRRH